MRCENRHSCAVEIDPYLGIYKYMRRIHVARDPYVSKEIRYATCILIEIDPYVLYKYMYIYIYTYVYI